MVTKRIIVKNNRRKDQVRTG